MTTVDATAYLTVEGTRSRYGDRSVTRAKIVNSTQSKPATLRGDQVAVKVTIRLPIAGFDPLQPEALVIVPEDLLIKREVEVEAHED